MPDFEPFDPLGDSADPRRYIPLDTSERILADVAARLRDGFSPILLSGSSGVGKTLLLRVLAERERLRGQRVAFVPFLSFSPEECARWLLHQLGIRALPGVPAETALLQDLETPGCRPTLVLVDEIQAAPEPSVRKLGELARSGRPTLTLVVAGSPCRSLERRRAALVPEAALHFPGCFPDNELGALCGAILAAPGPSADLRQMLLDVRPEIVRAASGVPRLLKAELEVRIQNLALMRARRRQPVEVLHLDTWEPRALAADGVAAQAAADLAAEQPAIPTPEPHPEPQAQPAALPALRPQPQPVELLLRAPTIEPLTWRPASVAAPAAPPILALPRFASQPAAARPAAAPSRVRTAPPLRVPAAPPPHVPAAASSRIPAPSPSRLAPRPRNAPRRPAAREALGAWAARAAREQERARKRWADASSRVARAARTRGELALAGGTRVAHTLGSAAGRTRAGVVRARHRAEAGLAVARRAALPAAVLCLLALLPLSHLGTKPRHVAAAPPIALHHQPPTDAAPVPVPAIVPRVVPVRVQVNARPWARIRIDGVDVGPTPLSRPLTPGVYSFDAEFPDGRRVQKRIDVGPAQRFVSLQ